MNDLVQMQANVSSDLNDAIAALCRSTTKTMEAESDAFAHYLQTALSHCDLHALADPDPDPVLGPPRVGKIRLQMFRFSS